MSLDKTVWREAMAHYRAWNEAKFVEQVLTAGQKTQAEKWQEYQDLFAFGRRIKPEPSLWEQKPLTVLLSRYDWSAGASLVGCPGTR